MDAKISTYEAVVVWGNDLSTRAVVKVDVPDGRYIFPYIVERAMEISDDQRVITITSIKRLTCDGCINDYANQLGHVGPGGCLEEKSESKSV